MSGTSRILRGTGRAAIGVVVVAVAATAVVVLGGVPLPAVERTPPSVEVDTMQDSTQRLVCAGAFSVLGADPARPEAAIPVGAPVVSVAGEASETASLARPEGGDGPPEVLAAPSGTPLAAAQVQSVDADTARGVAASSCATPLNEQWLLGGDTMTGVTTTLSLGNPGAVPATVQLSLYDENGPVVGGQTAAVLVPPGSEQTVALNGYAPERGRIAVRVVSTGAPVTASLGIVQSLAIEPFALDTVTRQSAPAERLVVPGVTNIHRASDRGPNDLEDTEPFKVTVRVLAPGDGDGKARVTALDDGKTIDLGEIGLVGGQISELQVPSWPKQANAVVIEADVPVVGGVMGSVDTDKAHDFAWFAPAPELAAETPVAVPVVSGGKLVLANPGEGEAEVEIDPMGEGKSRKVEVPSGAAVVVDAPASATLTSSAPVHAGVRYAEGADLAGYPVLGALERDGVLTVYTR
ncbi:DUF5719 family protein [Leucobacter ruminantium]|uniref:Large extracellular alpha-helical protein n=1 Tax=Leucobacter ruminantium TaxID=1289170 RepID=A0A939LVT8_9MICO|nr:DUF5719 family protein [Leucobacter ruminantium]MBO1805347.1 hypothetical protein [Leucobacter ruminantium]